MSYQALARKWRPRQFSEVIGQQHVLKALTHALDENRVHHAFLFTGTRGVGKTTIARIFAKSLNCDAGVSSTPCGVCAACQDIDAGRFVDLVEIDAASRTGVDDMRELIENVQYSPARGRTKVYLIDEVHMLSTSAFNALLKTLEEPPEHVKFLLATTDPQKLPITILSRCLQFNLKRLSEQQIAEHLADILQRETIQFESEATHLVGRAADGSMRDALSLLDQAIPYGNGELQAPVIREMLGLVDTSHVQQLLTAVAQADGANVLRIASDLAMQAPDYAQVFDEMMQVLQNIALQQVVPSPKDDGLAIDQAIMALAEQQPADVIQLWYDIALRGKRDLPFAASPKLGFEMTLLRLLAFAPQDMPPKPPPSSKSSKSRHTSATRQNASADTSAAAVQNDTVSDVQGEPRARASAAAMAAAGIVPKPTAPAPKTKKADASESPASRGTLGESAGTSRDVTMTNTTAVMPTEATISAEHAVASTSWQAPDWPELVGLLNLNGAALQLARHCVYRSRSGQKIQLVLDQAHSQFSNEMMQKKLAAALSEFYGEPLVVDITFATPEQETPAQRHERQDQERQNAAEQSIAADPNVQRLQEMFDAELQPGSVSTIQ